MTRRALLIATIALVLLNCVVWYVSASIIWGARGSNRRFGLARCGRQWSLRRGGLLIAVEAGDLAFSLVEGIVRTASWWPLSGLAATAS